MTPGVELDKVTTALRCLVTSECSPQEWEWDRYPGSCGRHVGLEVRWAMEAYDEHHALLASEKRLRAFWMAFQADDEGEEW